MCFNKHAAHPLPHICGFHVLCWKRLDIRGRGLFSPFRDERYYLGKRKEAQFYPLNSGYINKGLHSYSNVDVLRGFGRHINFFPALIPAGTRFFFNPARSELVSEALVVFATEAAFARYETKRLPVVKL